MKDKLLMLEVCLLDPCGYVHVPIHHILRITGDDYQNSARFYIDVVGPHGVTQKGSIKKSDAEKFMEFV
jgi:hypothetical protein